MELYVQFQSYIPIKKETKIDARDLTEIVHPTFGGFLPLEDISVGQRKAIIDNSERGTHRPFGSYLKKGRYLVCISFYSWDSALPNSPLSLLTMAIWMIRWIPFPVSVGFIGLLKLLPFPWKI